MMKEVKFSSFDNHQFLRYIYILYILLFCTISEITYLEVILVCAALGFPGCTPSPTSGESPCFGESEYVRVVSVAHTVTEICTVSKTEKILHNQV